MTVPPLGPPPRFLGMKITSNRIEAALVMFVTLQVCQELPMATI